MGHQTQKLQEALFSQTPVCPRRRVFLIISCLQTHPQTPSHRRVSPSLIRKPNTKHKKIFSCLLTPVGPRRHRPLSYTKLAWPLQPSRFSLARPTGGILWRILGGCRGILFPALGGPSAPRASASPSGHRRRTLLGRACLGNSISRTMFVCRPE